MNNRPSSTWKFSTHFLNQHSIVRGALIGIGIGLLVVGSIIATVATLGMAAPALGISLSAMTSFFGSAGIAALVGAGIVTFTALLSSVIFAVKQWFNQSNSIEDQSSMLAADVDAAAAQPLANNSTASLQENLLDDKNIIAIAIPPSNKLSLKEKHNEAQRIKSKITREQIYTLLILRKRGDNLFSDLPIELIENHFLLEDEFDDSCDIGKALRYTAKGEEKDVIALIALLDENPSLLLQAGNVTTPGGLEVKRVTIYEFCLGAGDPKLAAKVQAYFERIPQGEGERLRQYERYRLHLKSLVKQTAFDLKHLIDIIKQSPPPDIRAALNKHMAHESVLRDALIAFRNAVKPKIKAVGMHYEHYTTLQQALDLLHEEWEALSDNYNNYDKCDLVWRQIIGYLERSLPAVDRFAFARAFKDKNRTVKFIHANDSFPGCYPADNNLDLSGLGFDQAILGAARAPVPQKYEPGLRGSFHMSCVALWFRIHMSSKNKRLTKLMPQQMQQPSGCIIC